MIAVMKQRNVEAALQAFQELAQRAWPFRKLEAKDALMLDFGAPTDEVAGVRFRELVLGQVPSGEAVGLELMQDVFQFALPSFKRRRREAVGFACAVCLRYESC